MMDVKIGGGSLSQNTRRTQENHPFYKGKLTLDRDVPKGAKIWLAGWEKEGDDGVTWISLAASVTGEQAPGAAPGAGPGAGRRQNAPPPEDEIPF